LHSSSPSTDHIMQKGIHAIPYHAKISLDDAGI
jgi:hypothetical protein